MRYDPIGKRLRMFGVRDGLPSQEFQMQPPLMLPKGLGLASTNEGLLLFDPARIHDNGIAPVLTLDAVTLRREDAVVSLPTGGATLVMRPEDRDLHVSARLLSLADAGAHRYRFWLHGYDAGWVMAGASGEREFSRLEPGKYRLEVSASNADGLWSPSRGFRLQVDAPWWRTNWALALWAASLLLLLWLAARQYRHRLRGRHAEHLREHQRQLSDQGSEAKTRFLATLGHEIRTPMTGVLGMAELLQGGTLEPKQRSQVAAIQRAGEHLLRLVNDALDLARIEAGKLTLDEAPFDLHALLDDVAAMLEPMAQAKGLLFSLQRAPGTPRALRGDAGRVRQILLNLGCNAIKFTESGEVALRSAATPHGLMLEISDTGAGHGAEQVARLFQRFEQADGLRTAQRHGGSGLGLAICQELAVAMNGRIDVQSVPGQGTTLRVNLPLASARLDELVRPPARATRREVDGLRILVVEDDATVAEVIIGLLRFARPPGGACRAGPGRTDRTRRLALRSRLPRSRPARPRWLRTGADHPRPGSHAGADRADRARRLRRPNRWRVAAGMHGFLRKPVTSQLLQDKIERVLRARRAAQPAAVGA